MTKTVYDWHRQDTRMTELKDICTTAAAGWGGGGNNMPYVLESKEPTIYRGDSITSPINGSNPQPGDACHTLTDDNRNYVVEKEMDTVVRRLTPLECERVQGYPDHWTDIGEWVDSKGKKHKDADSPRYKALGNSIALPFWEWMAKRMCGYITDHKPTMGSLFDGIGGFPLVFSRCGCEPIWASEIEEFPIAVTKIHFPESEDL